MHPFELSSSAPTPPSIPSSSELFQYVEMLINQDGPSYRATHHVKRFIEGSELNIWKEPAFFAGPVNLYYAIQDWGFLGSRGFVVSGRKQLLAEKEKLEHLAKHAPGVAPELVRYLPGRGALVKRYIPGKTFREMGPREQAEAIPPIVDLVSQIHRTGIAIGDAHIKNAIHNDLADRYMWLGFSGHFSGVPVRQRADDLLKLAYSTFTETRDLGLAKQMARELANYGNPNNPNTQDTKNLAFYLAGGLVWSRRLQFATRFPDKEQYGEFQKVLLESLSK